ncbi:MAG: YbgC/FadM family acyl-CoA thioesterase [Hyphomonas sp.]|nr:YbgC/FadM family acyl-CoA thioesterase [Hyphomonas sp.]
MQVRVYYEDTDFTGMVYHANYLRYFERGRSDWLRGTGLSHQELLSRDDPAAFTLTRLEVDYKRAARVDDLLRICTRYLGLDGCRLMFRQTCMRGNEVIAETTVDAVMIHPDGRPRRPVRDVVERLALFECKGDRQHIGA